MSIDELRRDHSALASRLDSAHRTYLGAVEAALDATDAAAKSSLHEHAIASKAALAEAAHAESAAYIRLMDAMRAAMK